MLLVTYFDKLVSNIQPSQERVELVSEAHNALRAHLLEDADLKYPPSDSFLSGSYARHTAVEPIKDVDVIVLVDPDRLGRSNPAPRSILEDYKRAIDDFYDKVELQDQRRSIGIFLEEDDIRMDVVPAIARSGKHRKLLVPDRQQREWIDSHPQGHIDGAADLNANTNGQFVRVVKLLKWWRRKALREEMVPKSFLTETLVVHHMVKADSVCEAFEGVVQELVHFLAPHARAGTVPEVPDPAVRENDLSQSCEWTVEQVEALHSELVRLGRIVEAANHPATSRKETIRLWQSVFGELYPVTLEEQEQSEIDKALFAIEPVPRHVFPYSAQISAQLTKEKGGKAIESYPNNGRKLPKHWWLCFKLVGTNVPPPFEINWKVTNHGREARVANQLSHNTFPGQTWQWESLLYRGHHFMDCEVWRDRKLVAMARHKVNIL